jgi:hypothetical protein
LSVDSRRSGNFAASPSGGFARMWMIGSAGIGMREGRAPKCIRTGLLFVDTRLIAGLATSNES